MIRHARRVLQFARTALTTRQAQLAIAGLALDFGVKIVVQTVRDMVDELEQAKQQLDRLRVAAAAPAYPGPADLDPLGRGGATVASGAGEVSFEPLAD